MESNIPQEIKDKIAEYSCDDLFVKNDVIYGYSLALPEISALKAEVERLTKALEESERLHRTYGW